MAGGRYREGREPSRQPSAERPEAGLCARCLHACRQQGARGSAFWRCRAADRDPALLRYPRLPVRSCRAFASDES